MADVIASAPDDMADEEAGVRAYPVDILQSALEGPEKAALLFDGASVSYGELMRRTAGLMRTIQHQLRIPRLSGNGTLLDATKGIHAALCCKKGIEWVAATCAFSMLGMPYTIVDPRLGEQQRTHIWQTWNARILLHDSAAAVADLVKISEGDRVVLVDVMESAAGESEEQNGPEAVLQMVGAGVSVDDAAFVDWTTGTSSGKPKGVVTYHRHLANMLRWRDANYPFGSAEVIGVNQFPSWYWWMAMCRGKTTSLIPSEVLLDSQLAVRYFHKTRITRIDCSTPSLLLAWLQDPLIALVADTLGMIVLSGEALPLETCTLLHSKLPSTTIVNLLSTTEAGDVAAFELPPAVTSALLKRDCRFAPVGLPLQGVNMQLIPYHEGDGASGEGSTRLELGVSGIGVPSGTSYLGDDTAAANFKDHEGARTWFTKDSVDMLAIHLDGSGESIFRGTYLQRAVVHQTLEVFELKGRLNLTAKVRGFRVDLAEVRRVVKATPPSELPTAEPILDVVAVVHDDTMTAFVKLAALGSSVDFTLFKASGVATLPRSEHDTAGVRGIRDYLLKNGELQPASIPSRYVFTKTLPVTATGKVDGHTLTGFASALLTSEESSAQPDVEVRMTTSTDFDTVLQEVQSAWVALLGRPAADAEGTTSIWDIGAHSLTITRLANMLSLRVADLIEVETLTAQAELVVAARKGNAGEAQMNDLKADSLPGEDIAVVGIGVRWPVEEGNRLDRVIASLSSAQDTSRVVPVDTLLEKHGLDVGGDTDYVRRSILLNEEYVTGFDPAFWGLSAGEAQVTEPTQRALIEVSYEAMVDSGYPYRPVTAGDGNSSDSRALERNVGVFACGASLPQYLTDVLDEDTATQRCFDTARYWALEVGNDKDYCATRLSHIFDLHGPSQTVQSACSSGLLCIANAVASLRTGSCRIALVSAASIQTPQDTGYQYQPGMVWSVDGRCRPFDAAGGGTCPGNAAVSFVLRPLSDAVRQGDKIYSVIKGCGVSNDGHRKHSFSAPSKSGQVEAIQRALADSRVDPATVTMVEGHGTGTAVGDPIELAALADTYHASGSRPEICLGSVKGHIGHANTAAGAAGFLKAVLSLHTATLYPTANHTTPNEHVAFPFRVLKATEAWEGQRRCGVSSFGVGGTNVHVVCESYSAPETDAESRPDEGPSVPIVLPFTAKSKESLGATLQEAKSYLGGVLDGGRSVVKAVQATLLKRPAYAHRGFVSVGMDDAIEGSVGAPPIATGAGVPSVLLCFPGQGGLSEQIASGLLSDAGRHAFPLFADTIEQVQVLLGNAGVKGWDGARFQSVLTSNTLTNEEAQLKLYCIEYALGRVVLQSLTSECSRRVYFVGHSIGEIVAATLHGALSLEEAVRFVLLRGQLIDQLPADRRGAMVSLAAGKDEVTEKVLQSGPHSGMGLACINSVDRVVVSGTAEQVSSFMNDTEVAHAYGARRIATSAGFHSSCVDPCLDAMRDQLSVILGPRDEAVQDGSVQSTLVSAVTGDALSVADARSVEYWVAHMRRPVDLVAALRTVFTQAAQSSSKKSVSSAGNRLTAIECGPQLLTGCVTGSLSAFASSAAAPSLLCTTLAVLPKPSAAGVAEVTCVLRSLARAWQAGAVSLDAIAKKTETVAHAAQVFVPPLTYSRMECWPEAKTKEEANTTHRQKTSVQQNRRRESTSVGWYSQTYTRVDTPAVESCSDGFEWPCAKVGTEDPTVERGFIPVRGYEDFVAAVRTYGRLAIVAYDGQAESAVDPDAAVRVLSGVLQALQHAAAAAKSVRKEGNSKAKMAGVVHVLLVLPASPVYATAVGAARCAAKELQPDLAVVNIVISPASANLRDRESTLSDRPSIVTKNVLDTVFRSFCVSRWRDASAAGGSEIHVGASEFRATVTNAGRVTELTTPVLSRLTYDEKPVDAATSPPTLKGRTRVIVTGGTSGVGKLLVQWCRSVMDEEGEIVVVSRRAHVADTKGPGATVVHVQCDVADSAGVERLVGGSGDPRPLGAIFHCAGVVSDATITNASPAVPSLTPLVSAKLHAPVNILKAVANLLEHRPQSMRPWVFLTSSSSSVLGPAGQSIYAAGNAFTDAIVDYHCQKQSPFHVKAVQWGGWTVGMTEEHNISPVQGEAFITPEDAMCTGGVFERLFARWGDNHVVGEVSTAAPTIIMPNKILDWEQYAQALSLPTSQCARVLHEPSASWAGELLAEQAPGTVTFSTVWPGSVGESGSATERAWAREGLLWLMGHQLGGHVVIPATMWIHLMTDGVLRAVEVLTPGKKQKASVTLEAVKFRAVLELRRRLASSSTLEVRTIVDVSQDRWRVRVVSRSGTDAAKQQKWVTHCEAVTSSAFPAFSGFLPEELANEAQRILTGGEASACADTLSVQLYADMQAEGFYYGGPFKAVEKLVKLPHSDSYAGLVKMMHSPLLESAPALNPGIVDACTHVSSFLENNGLPNRADSFTRFYNGSDDDLLKAEYLIVCAAPSKNNADKCDVYAFLADSLKPAFALSGLETVQAGNEETAAPSSAFSRPVWSRVSTEAGLSTLSNEIFLVALPADADGSTRYHVLTRQDAGDALLSEADTCSKLCSVLTSSAPSFTPPTLHIATVGDAKLTSRELADIVAAHWTAKSIVVRVVADAAPGPPVCSAVSATTEHPGVNAFVLLLTWSDGRPVHLRQGLVSIVSAVATRACPGGMYRLTASDEGIQQLEFEDVRAPTPEPQDRQEPRPVTDALWYEVGVSGSSGTFQPSLKATASGCIAEHVSLQPHEVVIRAEYWALNFLDVLLATGVMAHSRLGKVGGEVSGEVVAVGADVQNVKAGDFVAGLPQRSGLGNFAVLSRNCCAKVPSGVDITHASTVSLAYGTAYLALSWLAKVRRGDTVLVHAAAGGVGQACVNLAKHFGANLICTVGNPEKKAFLIETCGVDESCIFNSRNPQDFSTGVMAATGGRGVDVIINSLSDESMKASIRLLAPFGRFIELGKVDQQSHTEVPLSLFSMGQAYMSAHLDVLMTNPSASSRLLQELWELLAANPQAVPPLPLKTYPMTSVADAMTLLNSGKHIGKILVKVQPAAAVIAALPPLQPEAAESSAPTGILTGQDVEAFWASLRSGQHAAHVSDPLLLRSFVVSALAWVASESPAREPSSVTLFVGDAHSSEVAPVPDSTAGNRSFLLASPADSLRLYGNLCHTADYLDGSPEADSGGPSAAGGAGVVAAEVEVFVRAYVAGRMRMSESDVCLERTLGELGLDSLVQLQMSHALRSRFGSAARDADVTDDTSLQSLVAFIAAPPTPAGTAPVVSVHASAGAGPAVHRILCLHGFRASKSLFLRRLQPLLGNLDNVELCFVCLPSPNVPLPHPTSQVNAPHASSGPHDERLPEEEETYEWWCSRSRTTPDGVLAYDDGWDGDDCEGLGRSLSYLRDIAREVGPFDGVIGHSQGGAMAEICLAEGLARWGIFAATVRCRGYREQVIPAKGVKTLHIWDRSEPLTATCEKIFASYADARRSHHNSGHDADFSLSILKEVAAFLDTATTASTAK